MQQNMRMQMKSQKEAKSNPANKVSDKSEPFVPENIRRKSEAAHELEIPHSESSLDIGASLSPVDLNSIEQQLKNMFNFQARWGDIVEGGLHPHHIRLLYEWYVCLYFQIKDIRLLY